MPVFIIPRPVHPQVSYTKKHCIYIPLPLPAVNAIISIIWVRKGAGQ
ncbi:hypothetical protein C1O63_1511 [Dehalococcoides mccartyi]|nr:hypothetical protein C1O63_1511 [Dehalococcoides mccartyi]